LDTSTLRHFDKLSASQAQCIASSVHRRLSASQAQHKYRSVLLIAKLMESQ